MEMKAGQLSEYDIYTQVICSVSKEFGAWNSSVETSMVGDNSFFSAWRQMAFSLSCSQEFKPIFKTWS